MRSISLKTKIAIAVAVFGVVIVAGLGFFGISFFRQQLRSNIAQQQFTLVSSLASQIDDKILTAQTELATVAQIFPKDFSKAQEVIEGRLDTREMFQSGFALVDMSGKMLALAPYEAEMFKKNFGNREYFLKTLENQKPFISNPFITLQKNKHPIVMFTAPLFGESRKMQGMLLGAIDLTRNNFLGKLIDTKLGKNGYLYLFNTSGVVIMHPNKNNILKKMALSDKDKLLGQVLKGFEGSGETISEDGKPVLASYKRLGATNWILCASMPLGEAYGPIIHASKILYGAFSAIMLISIFLAWTLMSYMTVPLARFTEHVRSLMENSDKQEVFKYENNDEIGLLANSFNLLIKKLKEEKEALTLSEQRFATAFNASPESTSITRLADGLFLEVNEAFSRTTGFEREEVIGKTSLDLQLWPAKEDRVKMLQHLKRDGVVSNLEVQLRIKSGKVATMLLSAVPFDFYGEPSILLTHRDITEKKEVERRLQKKQAQLLENHEELATAYEQLKTAQTQMLQQEKMASIGLLSAGVAHELNNPIAFVASNLSTLEKYVSRMSTFISMQHEKYALSLSPEDLKDLEDGKKALKLDKIMGDIGELIQESKDGAERVRSIVLDLKSFSREGVVQSSAANLNDCLQSTLNIVWNELKYSATVKKEFGDIPITMCNPQQLNQVFLNLIVNASHAIENKGEIAIKTWHESGSIFVTIADNGCGIPPSIKEKIFEPFFTTKEVGKGTGLGLSITYDIIKKHNGEITVESEVGKGTAFTIRIPVCDTRESVVG
ncbi:PAS domain-containing sensor histidine kinase [Pelotalea chapellei]|uniref:histidine kinase n=1 Tax=Pelotalea chapellei TaxID=44671 RepID=A0ABS5U8P3_9BACT|nr:PAS domain-containing sensor histidine kinase [Pelotalea chapellei]MBT1072052.1 PAS domain S-box protein [Pelotalea chapellei]